MKTPGAVSPQATPLVRSDTEDGLESAPTSASDIATTQQRGPISGFRGEATYKYGSSEGAGIDAVKKLRLHYNINKVRRAVTINIKV